MTKDQFLQRFQLNFLTQSKPPLNHNKYRVKPTESAVLVALTERAGQLYLILTKRAQHLRHHPGQISFPGGKVEKNDKNIYQTALRETQEEIGIAAIHLNIVGQLNCYQTLTGFHITPVVALVKTDITPVIDRNEVEEIFYVPVSHFLNTQKTIALEIEHNTHRQKVHFMPYKHYNIWGATAEIISDLASHIR